LPRPGNPDQPCQVTPFVTDLPGVRLHGSTRGLVAGAIPTVFLHGFGGCGADWDSVWSGLGTDQPLMRYDQRGFGQSRAPTDQPYSHLADLLALLDAHGIAQTDLVGLSQGGALACQFALEHPQRVRRVILVSPALFGWDWSAQWRTLWRTVTTAARSGDMEHAKRLWADHPMFTPTLTGQARDAFIATLAAYSGAHWLVDRPLPVTPETSRLCRLAAPTLLLGGSGDLPDFQGIAALLARQVPTLRQVTMAGAGHLLNLERPAEVAAEIAAFLA